MSAHRILRRLRLEERGAAVVEFALILLPLSVLLMGSLELGYRVYAQSIVTGTIREAARMASTGGFTGAQIDSYVTTQLQNFRGQSTVVIDKRSYSDFTGVGEAEPKWTDSSGQTCFQDINGNGIWDADQGKAGLGGAEDVIYYQVDMTYDTLFPLSINALGLGPTSTVSANTIVSNEPYAAVSPSNPATICS